MDFHKIYITERRILGTLRGHNVKKAKKERNIIGLKIQCILAQKKLQVFIISLKCYLH